MPIKAISDWQEQAKVSLEEFFLSMNEYPGLYSTALVLHRQSQSPNSKDAKSKKEIPAPIEQLSPKGLALISYLYSQKDKSEAQPLVASTSESLRHIITMVDDAPPGTSVTVIFQATDSRNLGPFFREIADVHKTVFKIERTTTAVRMVNMDSVSSNYASVGMMTMMHALQENAQKKNRQMTSMAMAVQKEIIKPMSPEKAAKRKEKNILGPDLFSRQADEYQCGAFALKDARLLNRNTAFSSKAFSEAPQAGVHLYQLPPEHMKSTQSRSNAEYILQDPLFKEYGETVVNRKGKTLKQTFDTHLEHGYVHHFSEKYHQVVTDFVSRKSPKEVREAVERYDAANMTLDRLTKIYGPQLPKEEVKRPKAVTHQLPQTPKEVQPVISSKPTIPSKQEAPKPTLGKVDIKQVFSDSVKQKLIIQIKEELAKSGKENVGMMIVNARVNMVYDRFRNELTSQPTHERLEAIKDDLKNDPIAKKILNTHAWEHFEKDLRANVASPQAQAMKRPK